MFYSGRENYLAGIPPTPKDENKLSVYDGDKISPEKSYNHYCSQAGCTSHGVMAVSNEECATQELTVIEDGIPFPEHCSICFDNFSKNQIEKKAKLLKRSAEERGWLFIANDTTQIWQTPSAKSWDLPQIVFPPLEDFKPKLLE